MLFSVKHLENDFGSNSALSVRPAAYKGVEENADGRHQGTRSRTPLLVGEPSYQLRTKSHPLPGWEKAGQALGKLAQSSKVEPGGGWVETKAGGRAFHFVLRGRGLGSWGEHAGQENGQSLSRETEVEHVSSKAPRGHGEPGQLRQREVGEDVLKCFSFEIGQARLWRQMQSFWW